MRSNAILFTIDFIVPAVKIEGTVLDKATSKPVQGASVMLQMKDAGHGGIPTRSDRDGSFVLEGVAGGDYRLVVHMRGYAIYRIDLAVVEGVDLLPVRVLLGSGATLAGTATDYTGRPVGKARAVVMLESRTEARASKHRTRTAA